MSTVPEAERTQPLPALEQTRAQLTPEQARRLGGIRWGAAFFGWVTATAMAALLGAALTAAATAMGWVSLAPGALDRLGPAGGLALLVVVFAGYCCGGYVTGRMARFAGARQGVAVWLWTLALAAVGAAAAAATGAIAVPRPDELWNALVGGELMDGGVLSAGAAALTVGLLVVTLLGAVLGGLAGMRYHRRIDRELVAPPVD